MRWIRHATVIGITAFCAGALIGCATPVVPQTAQQSQAALHSNQTGRPARASRSPERREAASLLHLPFLGQIKVKYTQEVVRIPLDDATLMDMAFKVATLPDGRFVSAEFTKPGVRPYWHSVKELEYDYGVTDEEITGLPEQPASYTFEQVLGKLDGVERASRIQIMYVMLRGSVSGGARPAFIANVYGVSALYSSVPLPNRNEFKRIRHVFDESLKPLYSDNVL